MRKIFLSACCLAAWTLAVSSALPAFSQESDAREAAPRVEIAMVVTEPVGAAPGVCEDGPCSTRSVTADAYAFLKPGVAHAQGAPTDENPWCGVRGSGSNKRLTAVYPVTQTAIDNCCAEHNISPCPDVTEFM